MTTNHRDTLRMALEALDYYKDSHCVDTRPDARDGDTVDNGQIAREAISKINAALAALPADVSTQATCSADVSIKGGNIDMSQDAQESICKSCKAIGAAYQIGKESAQPAEKPKGKAEQQSTIKESLTVEDPTEGKPG